MDFLRWGSKKAGGQPVKSQRAPEKTKRPAAPQPAATIVSDEGGDHGTEREVVIKIPAEPDKQETRQAKMSQETTKRASILHDRPNKPQAAQRPQTAPAPRQAAPVQQPPAQAAADMIKEPVMAPTENGDVAVLADGMKLSGQIATGKEVKIFGDFTGETNCTNLSIAATGNVNGNVSADVVYVLGALSAEVKCRQLHIGPGGKFSGSVTADTVGIEGSFNGTVVSRSLLIRATAVVEGEFEAVDIGVERGATICGSITPGQLLKPAKRPAQEARAEHQAPFVSDSAKGIATPHPEYSRPEIARETPAPQQKMRTLSLLRGDRSSDEFEAPHENVRTAQLLSGHR